MENHNTDHTIPKSSFVTVLAWIFVVLSGFATFGSLIQNIIIHAVMPYDKMHKALESAAQGKNISPAAIFIFEYIRVIVGVFLVVAVTFLIASIGLLLRKNWARLLFISYMVLGIIWNIGAIVALQYIFSYIISSQLHSMPDAQSVLTSSFTAMRIVFSVISIGFSVLYGWIIMRLMSVEIKSEFGVSAG